MVGAIVPVRRHLLLKLLNLPSVVANYLRPLPRHPQKWPPLAKPPLPQSCKAAAATPTLGGRPYLHPLIKRRSKKASFLSLIWDGQHGPILSLSSPREQARPTGWLHHSPCCSIHHHYCTKTSPSLSNPSYYSQRLVVFSPLLTRNIYSKQVFYNHVLL